MNEWIRINRGLYTKYVQENEPMHKTNTLYRLRPLHITKYTNANETCASNINAIQTAYTLHIIRTLSVYRY